MRLKLVLAGLLAILLLPMAANAQTRSETQPYVLGLDFLLASCEEPVGNVGGACFALAGDEVKASIVISEDLGHKVGGVWDFRDAGGNSLGANLFCDSVSNLTVPANSTRLLVFVNGPALGPIDCLSKGSPGAGTTGTITATYELGTQPPPTGIDVEQDCLEAVPHKAGIKGVTDDGGQVSLDVAVLLDGVSQQKASDTFAIAAERSYAALGITLNVVSYTPVNFTTNVASGINALAKAHFGGSRPANADVVYTLTSKNITDAVAGDGVLGLADCIGGVEFDNRAFAVGEVLNSFGIGPVNFYVHGTAKVAAHEIGHLMGAHHHYANCVEGIPTELEDGEPSACTLMSNFADFDSLNFSALNSAVVRAHAVEYAAP
ncbi:MAG: zinc-dependent metalloprotease family protein [Actinomycetota bacterium]